MAKRRVGRPRKKSHKRGKRKGVSDRMKKVGTIKDKGRTKAMFVHVGKRRKKK